MDVGFFKIREAFMSRSVNMEESEVSLMSEPLMVERSVCGMCMMPDLRNKEAEKKDLIGLYRRLARIPEQTHSCNVTVAERNKWYYPDTDALVTFEGDLPIGVKTADCVPILIYSPDRRCVGAIHAGWKGTLGGIVDKVLDVLEERGVDPERLRVAFGPSISKEVYEVDVQLADRFVAAGFKGYVYHPYGNKEKPHIDLQGVNMERFMRRGVKRENVSLHSGCSYSSRRKDGSSKYASHRRSGGAPARMLTCIMLLSESGDEAFRKSFNS